MDSAKDIHVAPISRADADRIVKRVHYSGKVVQNSQLHLGVFLRGRYQVQLADDAGKAPTDETSGAIFGMLSPRKNATCCGWWRLRRRSSSCCLA